MAVAPMMTPFLEIGPAALDFLKSSSYCSCLSLPASFPWLPPCRALTTSWWELRISRSRIGTGNYNRIQAYEVYTVHGKQKVRCCYLEVKAYLNGIDVPDILAPRALFVKVFGSIGSVAGGLDAGKQGPLAHTGACIAALLSQGGSEDHHLSWGWLRSVKNNKDKRDLVTCGAAAGVAAAFRAPVGGVLFALEEVTSWWRNLLLWRVFFSTALVAVVLRTASSFCGDTNCGLYGHGGLIMYSIGNFSVKFRLAELVPIVMLGLFGGLMGSLFTLCNSKIVKFYSAWHTKHGPAVKILHGILISLITSACTIGLSWLGACTACSLETCPNQGIAIRSARFMCPEGHYNDLATLFLSSNDDIVRNLFSVGTGSKFRYSSLVIYLVSSYTLALVTYGTPVPSGLFLPMIMSGATYGRLVGMAVKSWHGGFAELDEGLYAVLGAASFLGGCLRVTVSVCVILLELTNNLLMLPLTMLVLLISKTTGDLINEGIYDQLLRVKRLPFLQESPEPYMMNLTAFDVCSRQLVTLNAIEKVKHILDVLQGTRHNCFPVMSIDLSSQKTSFQGIILRSHLLALLKSKNCLPTKSSEKKVAIQESLPCSDSGKPALLKMVTIKVVEKSSFAERARSEETFIDLQPFVNTSPYTVVDSMCLASAFTLFRSLGLRHLCVVPRVECGLPIVGMLTRHDFLPDHIFRKFPHLRRKRWQSLHLRVPFLKKAVESDEPPESSRL
ncbi:hypothetical protein GOP47_0003780 [Adiantum capillus-veneris]|uniref:Chloride channel protein n=1 Tax=Adiantum capillus-veneris TaxID=13818 RepID=A0A9D4V6X9_ADICA|nr:hypothetical protein GOP47_0003780 [Adiantum capillus-veneris]